ncbi:MAG: hypothetical protein JJV89_00040, partial [Desulfosarcina sp.]|nr:hypothetical protein [Desulfobacterales bacterium]
INQIKEQGYHQQYVEAGRKVILLGIDFSQKERNVAGFEYQVSGLNSRSVRG